MAACLTLASVTADARGIDILRQRIEGTFPEGDAATETVPELWRLLNSFRKRVTNVYALEAEKWSADTAASVASYARALLDASLHSRCGFLAEPQAHDARAEEVAEAAERRLHELCPEICQIADELSVRFEIPREQSRVLAVWIDKKERLSLSGTGAWDLLKAIDQHERHWKKILREQGVNAAAEQLSTFVTKPHELPSRGLGPLLHVRVGADLIIRAGYSGRHGCAVMLAATATHRKLHARYSPLEERLTFAGEPDTGVATLRAALLDYAYGAAPAPAPASPTPTRRLPQVPPTRSVAGGGSPQDRRKPDHPGSASR